MTASHESLQTPEQRAEQVLTMAQVTLRAAVGIVQPENPDADPLTVFPDPEIVRGEDKGMPLNEEQTERLLDQASQLGFGRPDNVTISEQGLTNAIVVLEGGQPHKMLTEALLVTRDEEAKPQAIIIAASTQRKVESAAEIASAERLFNEGQSPQTGLTEYDMALQMLPKIPGFRGPTDQEYQTMGELDLGYDVDDNYTVYLESRGQFTRVGFLGGHSFNAVPVTLMRIDDEKLGEDTATLLDIVAAGTIGREERKPLVFVTGGTYRPSRAVGVALAGLKSRRTIGLATYGNDLINEVRGAQLPPPVTQLPGELHEMARQAVALEHALRHIDWAL